MKRKRFNKRRNFSKRNFKRGYRRKGKPIRSVRLARGGMRL